MSDMTIGKVARAVGVGVETIRFYERRGLIEQPPRPEGGGYRVYSGETVRRVHFIRRAQELGFSLREIADLLTLRTTHNADASDVRRRATTKLQDVDQKIERLQRIREGLTTLLDSCPGAGPLQCCSILDALEHDAVLTGETTNRQERGMQTVKLTIGGMHCDGCAERIRTLLSKEPGVREANVSFTEGSANVRYNPHRVSVARLREIIEIGGFDVVEQNA